MSKLEVWAINICIMNTDWEDEIIPPPRHDKSFLFWREAAIYATNLYKFCSLHFIHHEPRWTSPANHNPRLMPTFTCYTTTIKLSVASIKFIQKSPGIPSMYPAPWPSHGHPMAIPWPSCLSPWGRHTYVRWGARTCWSERRADLRLPGPSCRSSGLTWPNEHKDGVWWSLEVSFSSKSTKEWT